MTALPQPMVTVIIPVMNEEKYMRGCLESVLRQDYPGERIEILVVDGMSSDGTRAVINQMIKVNPQARMRLLENPKKIVPMAMNLALGQAVGEIIIRVDGHCIIAGDYVRRCVEHLDEAGIDGVGGAIRSNGETPIAKVISSGMSSPFGVGDSAFRTVSGKRLYVDTVPFPAYRREVVHRAGLYDEELVRNQDDEYNYRIRELGGRLLLAEDVQSVYFSRTTLAGLWRQYYQYGFWKVRVLQKHPRQMRLRQFIPPFFLTCLLIGSILTIIVPWGWICLSLVAGAYLLVNLAVSLVKAVKERKKNFILLPVVFAILHFSYGLGFLAGLVHFWNRWGDKTGQTPRLVNQ